MGLFDWFKPRTPRLPIGDEAREWVDRRWEWLEQEFGVQRCRGAPLVLPNHEFFPQELDGSEGSIRRLLDRVSDLAGIDPASLELVFYDESDPMDDNPGLAGGERAGTAGHFCPLDDGRFLIALEVGNLADPMALVATMAHEVGHVHLNGHERIGPGEDDCEPLTDLLTVFLGFGLFTANSVIQEASWEEGGWSGWRVGKMGYLTMDAFGYALARYARTRGETGADWKSRLRPDVRSAFKRSMAFLEREDQERFGLA